MKCLFMCISFIIFSCLSANAPTLLEEEDLPMQNCEVFKIVEKFTQDCCVILEAGGHLGEDTVRMKRFFPKSKIYTFEPHPGNYKKLLKKIKDIRGIYPYPLALLDKNGKISFNLSGQNSGASSIFDAYSSKAYQDRKVVVQGMTLNTWAKKSKVERIDFMWLDMEGAELLFFKGASDLLKTVSVIKVETNFYGNQGFIAKGEVWGRKGVVRFQELNKFLVKKGFRVVKHLHGSRQGNAIYVRGDLIN